MNKKKWALLILLSLLLSGYFKLFYKTYSKTVVPASADCVIALDVKKVTNTVIWDIITSPSKWKFSSSKKEEKDKVGFDDMVKIPDYVFAFHSSGQSWNAWYTVLEINDREDFNKGLQQYQFEKSGTNSYFSRELQLAFIEDANRVLVSHAAGANNSALQAVATELFTQKIYISKERLKKNIDAASHLSVQVNRNSFFTDDQLITANFDNTKIWIDAIVKPMKDEQFASATFLYNDSSLCNLAFTSLPANLIPDSISSSISRALNVNIDSLLLPTNKTYQLTVESIRSRIDSAISYTYDDNFNPVEKVVVNKVEEPAFDFVINGPNADGIYQYLNGNGKLEKTAAGDWFTPMPFVKSYCSTTHSQLKITAANYPSVAMKQHMNAIFFSKLLFTKIPAALWKYSPDELQKALSNMASLEIVATNEKEAIHIHGVLNKNKNDLGLIEW